MATPNPGPRRGPSRPVSTGAAARTAVRTAVIAVLATAVAVGGLPRPEPVAAAGHPAATSATAPTPAAALAAAAPAASTSTAAPAPAGPKVTAHSAILVDPADGSVLWQRNPTIRRAPASLTKMLTALTAKASLPMTRRMIVSPSADKVQASRLALGAGHDISVAQALTALMMISANDMAVVLAQHSAGSVHRFNQAMELEGRRLGLTRSSWRNPHGLDAGGHLSTAFDLAILARAVLRDPWLAEVARRRRTVAFVTPDGSRRSLYNKGRFLRGYRGAIGVKTGFTDDAGRCVAAAAARGGRTLVAIVLRSADPAKDAAALMDWGFGPGRAVRTGARLPPYVAPASVTELLAPGAAGGIPPPPAEGVLPVQPPSPAPGQDQGPAQMQAWAQPTPTPPPSPVPGSAAPAASALPGAAVLVGFGLLALLTLRARRRAIDFDGKPPGKAPPPSPPPDVRPGRPGRPGRGPTRRRPWP